VIVHFVHVYYTIAWSQVAYIDRPVVMSYVLFHISVISNGHFSYNSYIIPVELTPAVCCFSCKCSAGVNNCQSYLETVAAEESAKQWCFQRMITVGLLSQIRLQTARIQTLLIRQFLIWSANFWIEITGSFVFSFANTRPRAFFVHVYVVMSR